MPTEVADHDPGGEHRSALLSDPHSRRVLDYLRRADGPVDVATLATHVVADLTGTDPEDVPPNVRRRVATWLHHGQLPALADHDVVEYDPERGTVSSTAEGRRDRSSG